MHVECSRCHAKIEVFDVGPGVTAGYYDTTGYWGRFANPTESIICDSCMWHDPRYIQAYGRHNVHGTA